MAWLQILNESQSTQKKIPVKVTKAQDLTQNADCVFADVSNNNCRTVRVAVKRCKDTNLYAGRQLYGASVYVHIKLFTRVGLEDYVKHSEISLQLNEFKAFYDSFLKIGEMIESKLNETHDSKFYNYRTTRYRNMGRLKGP